MRQKMIDIANRTGVSPATVSNALNGKKGVSERTKEAILKAAREIGYSRDMGTGTLQKVIRLVVFKKHGYVISDTPFFASLIEGIEKECRLLGYEMLISHVNTKEDNYRQFINHTTFKSSSGILLLATEMNLEDLALFKNIDVPVVVIDGNFRDTGFNSVLTNSIDAAYKAVVYLIENGHVHIGYLHSSVYINNFHDRKRGYQYALEEHSLKAENPFEILLEPTMEGAYRDMKAFLEKIPPAFTYSLLCR